MVNKKHLEQKKSDNKRAKFYCLSNKLAESLDRAFRIIKAG